MLEELSRSAWIEWIAYYEAEPWGEDRADLRSAVVASVTYNMMRGRGTAARPPKDFMAFKEDRRIMTKAKRDAFVAMMRAANAADH